MTSTPPAVVRGAGGLVGDIVGEIAHTLGIVFESVEAIRAETADVFAAPRSGRPSAADLGVLRTTACGQVGAGSGLISGAGFVAAPDALSDRRYFLEWWSAAGDAAPQRLVADLDPTSDLFHDYTRLPWYVVPRDAGRRHITGPYVDYLCTDEYTLTFTIPVSLAGRFVGVAGADVFVSRFESLILPRLRRLAEPATLVNSQGRVIVSNQARQVTGSLIRQPDIAALWAALTPPSDSAEGPTLYRCGDFPIGLLVAESVHSKSA